MTATVPRPSATTPATSRPQGTVVDFPVGSVASVDADVVGAGALGDAVGVAEASAVVVDVARTRGFVVGPVGGVVVVPVVGAAEAVACAAVVCVRVDVVVGVGFGDAAVAQMLR